MDARYLDTVINELIDELTPSPEPEDGADRRLCHLLDSPRRVVDDGPPDVLANRPGHQHVVITGRNAPAELLAIADLACDVRKLKHPFDQGVKGQPGIEW